MSRPFESTLQATRSRRADKGKVGGCGSWPGVPHLLFSPSDVSGDRLGLVAAARADEVRYQVPPHVTVLCHEVPPPCPGRCWPRRFPRKRPLGGRVSELAVQPG